LSAACTEDKALNIKDPAKANRIFPMISPVIFVAETEHVPDEIIRLLLGFAGGKHW